MSRLSSELVIQGYCSGVFPMAHPSEGNEIFWHAPDPRAILPIDDFHIPSNLARLVRQRPFTVATDRAFDDVIRACASRDTTWISEEIIRIYIDLFEMNFAHSVECWSEGTLVGGLYGVAVKGAFFGESMFFRASNASKVALVHLFDMLLRGGYLLHDIQYLSSHMEQFGAVEIPREQFLDKLDDALDTVGEWQQPRDIPLILENENC